MTDAFVLRPPSFVLRPLSSVIIPTALRGEVSTARLSPTRRPPAYRGAGRRHRRARRCPRCQILFAAIPRARGRRICRWCAEELVAGRVQIGDWIGAAGYHAQIPTARAEGDLTKVWNYDILMSSLLASRHSLMPPRRATLPAGG